MCRWNRRALPSRGYFVRALGKSTAPRIRYDGGEFADHGARDSRG